jgi:hypothetical protein
LLRKAATLFPAMADDDVIIVDVVPAAVAFAACAGPEDLA